MTETLTTITVNSFNPAWTALKDDVTAIQQIQIKDGSIPETADHPAAHILIHEIMAAVAEIQPKFPHDDAYLTALAVDLTKWADSNFGIPDFLDSLLAFTPAQNRVDGLTHLVVFPMYTQNGSLDRHLEAVLLTVTWPAHIAELEKTYNNAMFVPVQFLDFTAGYNTNSAVLFPETVATRETPTFTWGAIFQDREAARYRTVVKAAAEVTKMDIPTSLQAILDDQQTAQHAFIMWDLIHDRAHMRGDLPFDPFMIKQRMPYFLYTLEELRCDLTAYRECVRLQNEITAIPSADRTNAQNTILEHSYYTQMEILFDRLFRFPLTGDRVRNYDGLGGQIIFAWLHKARVLNWTDTQLSFDWDQVPGKIVELADAIDHLYWSAIDRPKQVHWLAAHDFISNIVATHPASVWAHKNDPARFPLAGTPKEMTDAVLDDEFPLSMFYEALGKKLGTGIFLSKVSSRIGH
jgi:hypothetical protein